MKGILTLTQGYLDCLTSQILVREVIFKNSSNEFKNSHEGKDYEMATGSMVQLSVDVQTFLDMHEPD
jgi:hypothetical protein